MKKIIFILSTFACSVGFGQQTSLNSQYLYNEMLVNPGATGSKDYIPVQFNFRKQWSGFKGSPTTQFLSAHANLGKRMGFGGIISNDVAGPSRRTGITVNTSYSLKLDQKDEHKLGLGLGISLNQHVIDLAQLTTYLPDDPATQRGYNYKLVPDANFGVYYHFLDKGYVGISAYNLVQANRALYDFQAPFANPLVRTYYLFGGYNFEVGQKKNFGINISTLFRAIETGNFQVDGTLTFDWKDFIWLGASYRHGDAIVGLIGGKAGPVKFGYSYDYTLSDIRDYSTGSHEFFIELQIRTKKTQSPESKVPWLKRNRVYNP